MKIRYVLPLALAFTPFANAVELHHVIVRNGTDGLAMVPLTISNSGKDARVELWFEAATGTFTILNDMRENLPVERLWCGLSGRAYATRVQITLDRTDAEKGTRAVSCGMKQNGLVCR